MDLGGVRGRSWVEGEHDQITFYEILKGLIKHCINLLELLGIQKEYNLVPIILSEFYFSIKL